MHVMLNGDPVATTASTLTGLLEERYAGLPPGHAVALNGCVVPRIEVDSVRLVAGDRVEVVTAVAGG